MQTADLQLPADWKLCRIAEAYDFTKKPRGLDLRKNGNEIPFFTMDQIPLGKIRVSEFTPRPAEKLGSGTYVENGDVMVAKITPSFENGKQAIVDIDTDFAFATTEVIPLHSIEEKSDNLFLFFFLLHPEVRSDLAGKMEGSTGRQRLSKTVLGDRLIPLPPFPEQKKIAHILSTVQRAIEAQERIIQTTTELKKALMQKLFTEGLRGEPQKQTEIGFVPESWGVAKIGDYCDVSTGTTPSTKNPKYYVGRNPFIKTGEITNNRISGASVCISDEAIVKCNLKVYEPGTLLIAMYGQGKTRGQISILEVPASTSQNAGAIAPSPEVDSEYLWYYLMSQYEQLRRSGIEGHISHLNLGYIKEILFPKPSLIDQQKIASMFRGLDGKVLLHQKKKGVLQDLFLTFLHELMTAKIRVNGIEIKGVEAEQ